MSNDFIKDRLFLEREARKLYQKREKVENLERQIKEELRGALSNPDIKKAVGLDVAKAIRDTESGNIDPLVKAIMNKADSYTWSK